MALIKCGTATAPTITTELMGSIFDSSGTRKVYLAFNGANQAGGDNLSGLSRTGTHISMSSNVVTFTTAGKYRISFIDIVASSSVISVTTQDYAVNDTYTIDTSTATPKCICIEKID